MTSPAKYDKVPARRRGYNQDYQIKRWPDKGKIDLWVWTDRGDRFCLKLDKQEAEELGIRLQFALYEQENGE